MLAGISALTASFEPREHESEAQLSEVGLLKAFTILHLNGGSGTSDLAHEVDAEEDEEQDDDDDSLASRMTAIKCNLLSSSSKGLVRHQSSLSSEDLVAVRCVNKDRLYLQAEPATRSMHLSTEDFNVALSTKLKKIQELEENERRRLIARSPGQVLHPRPFITTVKSGEFLMPPPEVAVLLGITPSLSPGSIYTTNALSDLDFENQQTRFRFRQQLMSLNRRMETQQQARNQPRSQVALKATENFARMRATGFSTITNATRSTNKDPHQMDQMPAFGNLMFDRRIVRGSTFAAPSVIMDCDQSHVARNAEIRRRQLQRKRTQDQAKRMALLQIGTPPPAPGRKHEPVQTELFLEELFERPDEADAAVQTDYFLDRPPSPPFCAAKTGEDASTQIEPGDLFDYDIEVQPILEVLVGRTIEQAMMEVLEEEEIATLREQQRKFLELRAAEKAEQQRLEEQDRRIREEKDRRAKQHEEAAKVQQETEERVAAAVLLTGYIAELLPAVLESLKISGFLLDEIKADVEEGFMPWLMQEVKREMGTIVESREILEEIVKEIIENRANSYQKLGKDYDTSRKVKVDSFEYVCEEMSVLTTIPSIPNSIEKEESYITDDINELYSNQESKK